MAFELSGKVQERAFIAEPPDELSPDRKAGGADVERDRGGGVPGDVEYPGERRIGITGKLVPIAFQVAAIGAQFASTGRRPRQYRREQHIVTFEERPDLALQAAVAGDAGEIFGHRHAPAFLVGQQIERFERFGSERPLHDGGEMIEPHGKIGEGFGPDGAAVAVPVERGLRRLDIVAEIGAETGRIEHRRLAVGIPSLACATGTTPLATATAEPPLDPPGVCAEFQGLRVIPVRSDSVESCAPNSEVVVLAIVSKPHALNRAMRL